MKTRAEITKYEKMRSVGHYFIACVLIALVLAPIMNKDLLKDPGNFIITVSFGLFYSLTGLYGAIWLFRYLDTKYNWIENLWKRFIIGIGVVVVWSLLIYAIITPILLYFFRHDSWESIVAEMKANLFYPPVMGMSGMVVIASIEFFHKWKTSVVKKENLKAEMIAYKYEALHNQLNPHFLFNSFNVLSELVYENQALAIKFVDQLQELYDKVLNGKQKELIPLPDELDFIHAYIFLLKTRFEDKIAVNIDVQTEGGEFIAPMVLQLLIENAVKHNKISKNEPLKIWIVKEADTIVVKNRRQIKKAGDSSKGTGLQNIKQRYSFFTDRPIEIRESADEFCVTIPILNKKHAGKNS